MNQKMGSPQGDPESVSTVATRLVLLVEYNGRNYCGFQLQAGQPTVQGELETALKKLTGDTIRIATASRTDSGVHARMQVVSFKTKSKLNPATFISGLNYYLPDDIAVIKAYRTDINFDVRRRAVSREYEYYILNRPTRSPLWHGRSYYVPGQMDIEEMNKACRYLIGQHDLASFASNLGVELENTVRRIHRAEVSRDGDLVVFNIQANAFLPHQVRNTVGALIRVGLGRMTPDEFYSIMDARKMGLAGPAAPACGLYLTRVNYARPIEEEI